MELSVESPCLNVTWKVRDFFKLPSEIGYFLDSPEIRFAADSYCLRLYPNGSRKYRDGAEIEVCLERLTSNFTNRTVSCKVGHRYEYVKGYEVDTYVSTINEFHFGRTILEKHRNVCVPDDTFTVVCYMRLKEKSSTGNLQSEEDQKGLLGQSVPFSSRWRSSKMELSTESPCQQVSWKVPNFFQLISKTGYSLNSSEFRFGGDRYCLRFSPKRDGNRDTADTVLQLVRLTSTFPEKTVLYKLGYRVKNSEGCLVDGYHYSGTSMDDDFGYCLSRTDLEVNKFTCVPDGTFTAVCSMRLKETQSGEAGNSNAEEKQEGLPETPDSVSCAVQTENLDSVSCAVQTEVSDSGIDKEIFINENWSSLDTKDVTLLSERMKDLLNKGSDHDLTICVQGKEFRAHRSVISARSPVFAMMLTHDTTENNTSTISIEDCDPDSFDDFLLYVYSGRTGNLTPSRALQIYYTADKYDFPALKERCVRILKTSLSVTSICDVVLLAAKHGEKELLEVASEFFIQNVQEILITVDWQRFLAENPVEANELYIKSIKFYHPRN